MSTAVVLRLALQEVGDSLRGHQAADAVDRKPRDRLEQGHVADAVTADHVADDDGADHVRQHLVDHQVAQVGVEQSGQAADAQVEPEQLGVVGRRAGTLPVQLAELGQRQREHLQRGVAAGDQGRELGRQQRGVGAGDDDLGAVLAVQRGDGAFPVGDLLHLVDNHHPRLAPPRGGLDVVDQIARRPHRFERERLLVDVDHLPLATQRGRELPQEDALARPPDAGHRGDDGGVEELPEAVEVVPTQKLHFVYRRNKIQTSRNFDYRRTSAGRRRPRRPRLTSGPLSG